MSDHSFFICTLNSKVNMSEELVEDSYRNGIGALEFRRSPPDALCGRCGAA